MVGGTQRGIALHHPRGTPARDGRVSGTRQNFGAATRPTRRQRSQLAGAPLQAKPVAGERLAELRRSGFDVAGVLAQPGMLDAQLRQQVTWLTALLACAVATAIAGYATMQKALSRERQLNLLKSNFVASISHELRAPVASMRVMAENLGSGIVADEARRGEYHRLIAEECWRLSTLIENVLDLARIEQERTFYHFAETDIAALVRDVALLLRASAGERRQRNRHRAWRAFEKPPSICDGLAVQRALINLIDNAIKFSPPETVITVRAAPCGSDEWELSVTDQGPGIPAAEHGKIFDRFYRIGSELRRETKGAGIGLSIVRHIAEGHGGTVNVESGHGTGSKFSLRLPLVPPCSLKTLEEDVQNPRIVEDELPMRNALFDLLQAQGYRVVTESDGESGLARALSEEFDLLLLDVMMPKLDGFSLCAEVRRRLPELPILMLTAKGQVDDRVTGLDAGADDYLVKPFSSRELLARVRALLRRFDRSATAVTKLNFGDVAIDFTKQTCTRAGNRVTLTAKEFGVLKLLAEYPGEPVSREHFLEVVWSYNAYPTTRTVDNQILSLRLQARSRAGASPTYPHGARRRLPLGNDKSMTHSGRGASASLLPMKRIAPICLLAVSAFAADNPKPPAKDARQLLQEGLFEEEANRDLKKASEDYAGVLAQFEPQRNLAATASFASRKFAAGKASKTKPSRSLQRLLVEFSDRGFADQAGARTLGCAGRESHAGHRGCRGWRRRRIEGDRAAARNHQGKPGPRDGSG